MVFLETPSERRRRMKRCFSEFIGQQDAIRQLQAFANSYFVANEPFSLLLAGPPSVGKTSLTKALAEGIDKPFINTDGNVLSNNDAIAAAMMETLLRQKIDVRFVEQENTFYIPPIVYFIDEVQDLPKQGQSALLRATERDDALLLTKPGHIYNCKNIIWVFSTTNPETLLKTLRSRFLTVECRPYTAEEVCEMIANIYKKFPLEVCVKIVYYAGLTPRIAKGFAKRVVDLARFEKTDLLPTVETVARMLNIDQWGMHLKTKAVLVALQNHPEGLILRELSQTIGCESKSITDTYLPPLMQVTSSHGSLVTHDDRYYISTEGEAFLENPWPLNV